MEAAKEESQRVMEENVTRKGRQSSNSMKNVNREKPRNKEDNEV